MPAKGRNKLRDLSIDLGEEIEYNKWLIYGPPGCGKTVQGGSDDDVLFIAPDPKGPASSKRMGSTAKRWPVADWNDLDMCAEYWYDQLVVQGNPCPYKWFCIDTITEVQDVGMATILAEAYAANPQRDKYIPTLQDYLKNQAMLIAMVKAFNELPVNVLYTAWDLQYTDAEGNEVLIPDIRGGAKNGFTVSKEVCGMMTSFGYMQVRNVKKPGSTEKIESRRITWKQRKTATEGVITAKDRTQCLAPYTDDLTLKELREKVEAYVPKTVGGTQAAPRRTARKAVSGTRRVTATRRGKTSGA